MIQEIHLDDLPKWESGGNKGRIEWSKSIGYKVEFIYDDIKGYIEILEYYQHQQRLLVKYKNNIKNIKTAHFKKAAIGSLIGLINHEYIYNKGDIVELLTGDVEILDQILVKDSKNNNIRSYIYKCLNDGYIGEALEYKLKNKSGCPVCSNRVIVKGINDIATTHPQLLNYFVNKNDAYNNSYGSRNEVELQCINCDHKKVSDIHRLVSRGFSCRKCGDGISYPEKFIYNLLEQLSVNFEIQKVFSWSDNRQYDFYLPELNLIIEAHGLQHYENNYSFSQDIKLKDIQENDKYKYELALKNKITNYIVLDCRDMDNDWIKNSIVNSEIVTILDLSKIDWLSCHMFACTSRVKEACNLWNDFTNDTKLISEKMKLSRQTVIKYLKQGSKLNWCDYDPKKNMIENGRNNGKKQQIPINMYAKDDEFLGFFESATELSKISVERFGIKLSQTAISAACRGEVSHHKGFKFKQA